MARGATGSGRIAVSWRHYENEHASKGLVHHRYFLRLRTDADREASGPRRLRGGDLRKVNALDDLKAQYGDDLWVASLDVTDVKAVRRVVDRAFATMGRIDVVVNNAAYGLFGAAEEVCTSFRACGESDAVRTVDFAFDVTERSDQLRSSLTLAALANGASRLHGGLGQVPGDLSYAVKGHRSREAPPVPSTGRPAAYTQTSNGITDACHQKSVNHRVRRRIQSHDC